LKIGGPTDAWPRYNRSDFNAWNKSERFIQEAGDALDFYSLYFYDLVERTDDDNGGINIRESASDALKTIATLDLLEQTSFDELGAVELLIISEYGTLNRGDVGIEAVYPEALQQWHQMRSITDKIMVFMDRPDRIEAATPFLNANTWWQFDGVDESLWSGIGNSTLFKGVNGNNYEASSTVESASLNRLRLTNGVPTFDGDLDVSTNWQDLLIEGEETAALTLTLSGAEIYDFAERTRTFYSNERVVDISSQGANASIDANLDQALSATLRVGISLADNETDEGAGDLPTFSIDINNGAWTQTVFSEKFGREDFGMTVREFDIPISALLGGSTFLTCSNFANDIAYAGLQVIRHVSTAC